MTSILLLLLAAPGLGGCLAPRASADAAQRAPAPPPPCRQARAKEVAALCASWSRHRTRRGDRPQGCELEPRRDDAGSVRAGYRLALLQARYRGADDRVQQDRFVVLHDGRTWRVVADLAALFPEQGVSWVGVQRRQLIPRAAGQAPLIRLETVTGRAVPRDCLFARERIRATLFCGQRGGAFRCARVDTLRFTEAEISGAAHPRSSQYRSDVAARCRATLRKLGLGPQRERLVLDRKERRLTEVNAQTLRLDGALRQIDGLLDRGRCIATVF